MKGMIIGTLIAIIILSCIGIMIGERMQDPTVKARKSDGSTVNVGHLRRAEFEGHTYIVRDYGYRGGICHDPDCLCQKR